MRIEDTPNHGQPGPAPQGRTEPEAGGVDAGADIHGRLGSLADATRTRLLLLLGRHELSVGELCAALQLPQSTVSRHLKVLGDEGWLATRSEGPSRYYRLSARLDGTAERLWQVVASDLGERPESAQDEARAAEALSRRRKRSQEFFSSAAGQWDALRAELFGAVVPGGLLALLPDDLVIGDLGCGTGAVAAELAPYAARVVAVDESQEMLSAARERLAGRAHVEVRCGALESLPLEAGTLDAAVLSLVLHYVPDPARALGEARRVLRPDGRLVIVDMIAHGRAEYREQMGHVWQGFTEPQLRMWLEEAGFERIRWHALRPDPQAKGPLLFSASAVRRRGAVAGGAKSDV